MLRGSVRFLGNARASVAVVIITAICATMLLSPGCSDEPEPYYPIVANDDIPRSTVASRASAQAMAMLTRSVAIDTQKFAEITERGTGAERLLSLRVSDENIPTIGPGTILLTQELDGAREVIDVRRSGDMMFLRARPIDYSPVTDAGEITFRVPFEGGAGEANGVRWGQWTLVNTDTGQRVPLDDNFTSMDFLPFDGFSICAEGGGVSACGRFKVRVVEGYLRATEGGLAVSVQSSYPDELAPLARLGIDETIDAKLVLEIEGGGDITYETCVAGWCTPGLALVREFEAGNVSGSIKVGVVVGIRAGVQDIKVQPGFELLDMHMAFGVSVNGGLDFDFDVPDPVFEPSFEVISLGEGFFRTYVGPKLEASVDLLGGWVEVGAEIGAYAWVEDTIDLDELFADCQLWHAGTEAGTEIAARAWGKVGGVSKSANWKKNGPSAQLMDWWSTGDLKVKTVTTGVDPDWNGYNVSSARDNSTLDPEWTRTLRGWLDCNDDLKWNGGFLCHEFADWLPFIGGIQDCDLVSTYHDVSMGDVMWNCAVSGGQDAVVCVEPFTTTTHTFEVNCISVFDALCLAIDEFLDQGLIKNAGLANSLKSKIRNAGAARDRGQSHVAENKLRATLNEIRAQDEKGLQPEAVSILVERIHTVIAHYLGYERDDATSGSPATTSLRR